MKTSTTKNATRVKSLVAKCCKVANNSQCFAQRIKPDTAEFLAAAKQAFADGEPIVFTEVRRILKDEFELVICENSIRRHIKGLCRC